MVSIDINSSLWIQMANFVVLVFILNFLLYKPIRTILKQRAEKKAQLSSEITASLEGAKDKEEALEAELIDARRQGAGAVEELKSEGRAKERELIDAATKEMEATVGAVRKEIEASIGEARDELKAQVKDFGKELAQKILGRSIQ